MLQTAVEGTLRVVTLDRPDRRNALTSDGLAELKDVFDAANEPVVYLQGAGEAFCAGADLDTVADLDREEAIAFARQGQRVASAIESYDGCVLAGIDGPARGGGVELALACDIRLGTASATLAESGVSHGLFGAWGGTGRLPRTVGDGNALDIALSGRVLDAEEALRMGLLSRIVSDPRDIAETIATNDAETLQTIKTRIRDQAPQHRQEEREAIAFGELIADLDESHFEF